MLGIFPLRNPTQHYDWGSTTAIPEFLGKPSSDKPIAELWLGAHPKAPSEVLMDNVWSPLHETLARAPEQWLGTEIAEAFDEDLPFLFKILAAGKPLSIQAHPDLAQAQEGYEREETAGISRWDRERNYRDRNHKPEIIYAITPFTVLCGFRPAAEIVERLARFKLADLAPFEELTVRGEAGLKTFFATLLSLPQERLNRVLDTALTAASSPSEIGPNSFEAEWMLRMAAEFPGDRGVLAPLFLNLRTLQPGQAMYTGPGILHAYLDGLGIELMANSDNVLRGGCTPKHVDAAELLRIVRFREQTPQMVTPLKPRQGVEIFPSPAQEFELSRLQITPETPFDSSADDPNPASAQILLCAEGNGQIKLSKETPAIPFARGSSFIVPAAVALYRIQGDGVFFRARAGSSPNFDRVGPLANAPA